MSAASDSSAISVRGIERSYKELRVLRGVDFDVESGSIFALLGSNGAGKTTLVKILATLLAADGGSAIVNGADVATQALAVRESISLTGRSLKHILRSPDTIITTAVMPIAMMLLFVYVFGGAIDTGQGAGSAAYVNYMLPGILLITVASGIAYTAFRLFMDTNGGIVERFRSMPIARSSILWAHVLTSVVSIVISLVIVVGIALLMGFRSNANVLEWLGVAGIVLLFTLALTWIAVIPGLLAKSVDGASAFSYPLLFLPFLSSAFVPTETMPGPVRWFAEHQPVTSIVDSIRALLAGQPVGGQLWVAVAWCVGILIVSWIVAMLIFRRKTG